MTQEPDEKRWQGCLVHYLNLLRRFRRAGFFFLSFGRTYQVLPPLRLPFLFPPS
jgi:hypothetical protein